MSETVLIISFACVAFVFFQLGKLKERIEWNKLIRRGIIPRPKRNY